MDNHSADMNAGSESSPNAQSLYGLDIVPAACRMYEKAGFQLIKRDRQQTRDANEFDNSFYELRFP